MRPPLTEQRVAAVVDALVAIASDIDGVTVSDGPLRQQVTKKDVVIIGDRRGGRQAIDVAMTPLEGMGGNAYLERITVMCSALSWAGTATMKPRRDRVVEILSHFRTQMDPGTGDMTLGDACDRARLGPAQSWLPENNSDGASVGVLFQIVAETAG